VSSAIQDFQTKPSVPPVFYNYHATIEIKWMVRGAAAEQNQSMKPESRKQLSIFWRESSCFWVVATAISVLSASLAHSPAAWLNRQLLIPIHADSAYALLAYTLIQKSLRLAIFIGVGLVVAHQVGLGAPVVEAGLRREPGKPSLSAPVIPIILTAILVLACTVLSNSPMLHPNRKLDSEAANKIMNSPLAPVLLQRLDGLGISPRPLTTGTLVISYLDGAIGGELRNRLFAVSVVILILAQIFGSYEKVSSRQFYWAAVIMVGLAQTAHVLWTQHENSLMVSGVFESLGLAVRVDSFWLRALRTSLLALPPAIAFGGLFVAYGIESAILASFCAPLFTHYFLYLAVTHFGLRF
jgi:hypothetical protein